MQIKTNNSRLACWQKANSFFNTLCWWVSGKWASPIHCGNATDTSLYEDNLFIEIPDMLIPNFTYRNFSNQHLDTWEQLLLHKSFPCIHVCSCTRLETAQTSTNQLLQWVWYIHPLEYHPVVKRNEKFQATVKRMKTNSRRELNAVRFDWWNRATLGISGIKSLIREWLLVWMLEDQEVLRPVKLLPKPQGL